MKIVLHIDIGIVHWVNKVYLPVTIWWRHWYINISIWVISSVRISRDFVLRLGKFCPDVNSQIYFFQMTLNIKPLPISIFYNMICPNWIPKKKERERNFIIERNRGGNKKMVLIFFYSLLAQFDPAFIWTLQKAEPNSRFSMKVDI